MGAELGTGLGEGQEAGQEAGQKAGDEVWLEVGLEVGSGPGSAGSILYCAPQITTVETGFPPIVCCVRCWSLSPACSTAALHFSCNNTD